MFGRLLLKIQTHINSKHEDFMEANKILSLDLNPADANPHSQTHTLVHSHKHTTNCLMTSQRSAWRIAHPLIFPLCPPFSVFMSRIWANCLHRPSLIKNDKDLSPLHSITWGHSIRPWYLSYAVKLTPY